MNGILRQIKRVRPEIPDSGAIIVYDGECPLCRRFADYAEARAKFGSIGLIDARTSIEIQGACREHGVNLDEGFVVVTGGQVFVGADAMRILAKGPLSQSRRMSIARIFGSGRFAANAYAILASGRRALLFVLGKKLINS